MLIHIHVYAFIFSIGVHILLFAVHIYLQVPENYHYLTPTSKVNNAFLRYLPIIVFSSESGPICSITKNSVSSLVSCMFVMLHFVYMFDKLTTVLGTFACFSFKLFFLVFAHEPLNLGNRY